MNRNAIETKLESMSRDELNVIARRFNVVKYRALKKSELVAEILRSDEDKLALNLQVRWWDRNHNHVYGTCTVLALLLAIGFYMWPRATDGPISDVSPSNTPGEAPSSSTNSEEAAGAVEADALPDSINVDSLPNRTDPNVANSLENLAALYVAQGRYKDAEKILKRVLEIRERLFTKKHPDYALSLQSLAELYVETARYPEAETVQLQAIAILKETVGETHPHTASALNTLAVIYLRTANYNDAAKTIERAIEIRTSAFGAAHPDLIPLFENLQEIYSRAGNVQKANEAAKKLAELRERFDRPTDTDG